MEYIEKSPLAPIVLFTYNRPEHTKVTLDYLSRCSLANESELHVFCDGPKENATTEMKAKIDEVKSIIKSQIVFAKVKIYESPNNKGLARNVIDGVSEIINRYEKVIVLEDDLLVGEYFLEFMNKALNFYEKSTKIKQVSGFLFPIDLMRTNATIFLPMTNTIGWATWKRAWAEIDFESKGYEELKSNSDMRKLFNLDNSYDYTKMLIKQAENEGYGSWGIRYWWSVFKNKGIVVYPDYPLIQHNDFDNSGTHLSDYSHFDFPNWDPCYKIENFNESYQVDDDAYSKLKIYIKKHNKITFKKILKKLKYKLFNI